MNIQPGVGYTVTQTGASVSLTVDQPWQFWTPDHPFTIYTFKDGSNWKAGVTPGTVNNVEPTMGGTQLSNVPPPSMNLGSASSSTLEYIYLQLPNSTGVFPDAPTVIHDASLQTADDTYGYILVGTVDISNGKVTQYISGSQWGERFKCGSNTAEYFYSLV